MAEIIDADGHIVEPRTFWNDYVEPQYRERLPRIIKDSDGIDRFALGDRSQRTTPTHLRRCAFQEASRPET
jgi:hypothetical protein